MTHFQDYWKTTLKLESSECVVDPNGDVAASVPREARFQGVPVWIHSGAKHSDNGVATDDGEPFAVDNAIRNVLFERYVPRDTVGAARTQLLRRSYYALKPLIPRGVQLMLQRANARSRLRNVIYPKWPQDDSIRSLQHGVLAALLRNKGLEKVPFIGYWPNGCRWAACFTHDIETTAGFAVVQRMADIEERVDKRSTWFVVPERYPVPLELLTELRERGHEIGVHGLNHDGRLFATREEFDRRVPLINDYMKDWGAVGFRSPALHRNADWIPDLHVQYDSSFIDTGVLEPQNGGVSTVHPYMLDDEVVELPITMPMDHHLINLLRTDVVGPMFSKFDWVVERFGLANFLYHPDYNLSDARLEDYQMVVERVRQENGGWVARACDIADWWSRRHMSKLVTDGGDVRIAGPAASDGAIWYAHLDRDGIRIDVS